MARKIKKIESPRPINVPPGASTAKERRGSGGLMAKRRAKWAKQGRR